MAKKEKLRCWQCGASVRPGDSLCRKCGTVASIYTAPTKRPSALPSQPSSWTSQPATLPSQPAVGTSQHAAFPPQPSSWTSQPAAFPPQPAGPGRSAMGGENHPSSWTLYSRNTEGTSANGTPIYRGDSSSIGFAVLGFFFPLVGLILFIIWNKSMPLMARSAGKGAAIGFAVGVALTCCYFAYIAVMIQFALSDFVV